MTKPASFSTNLMEREIRKLIVLVTKVCSTSYLSGHPTNFKSKDVFNTFYRQDGKHIRVSHIRNPCFGSNLFVLKQ